ncbi:unnamed protein product [Leptosia nina]|uniref:Uncharacterized protein n=1 Tax=Leptosia nina TaxID=320188 RepID=A0AAV1JFG6_9NEOP
MILSILTFEYGIRSERWVHHTHSRSAHCRWLCKAEAASMPLVESTDGIDTRPFPTALPPRPSPLLKPAAAKLGHQLRRLTL